MAETFANLAQTTVVTDSGTSMTVADGSHFPATGDFRVLVGAELIKVGARSGNTFSSLTRAVETGSAAQSTHAAGVKVKHVMTVESLTAFVNQTAGSGGDCIVDSGCVGNYICVGCNNQYLNAGDGGIGGVVYIKAGGATDPTYIGGQVSIIGGCNSGHATLGAEIDVCGGLCDGGSIGISGGLANTSQTGGGVGIAGGPGGTGGDVSISAGYGCAGVGGCIKISAGDGDPCTGEVHISGGNSLGATQWNGGVVSICGGLTNCGSAVGGNISLYGGGGSGSNGGNVVISGGESSVGGDVSIKGGYSTYNGGMGANINICGGDGTTATSWYGGNVNISGGINNYDGTRGNVSIIGNSIEITGNSFYSYNYGGSISTSAATNTQGGNVIISAGSESTHTSSLCGCIILNGIKENNGTNRRNGHIETCYSGCVGGCVLLLVP